MTGSNCGEAQLAGSSQRGRPPEGVWGRYSLVGKWIQPTLVSYFKHYKRVGDFSGFLSNISISIVFSHLGSLFEAYAKALQPVEFATDLGASRGFQDRATEGLCQGPAATPERPQNDPVFGFIMEPQTDLGTLLGRLLGRLVGRQSLAP